MAATPRLPLFENARGLLILLVAVGHALEPLLARDGWARGLYSAIYLFHIPAFAFLSGHLSATTVDRKQLAGIVTSLLLPLVVFQLLYVGFDVFVLERPFKSSWLYTPYWLLWFLLSLAWWRLLLPMIRRLPLPLLWSVGLAITAGFASFIGYPLSLARTLVFLPFFVAGSLVTRGRLARAQSLGVRLGAIGVFVALGVGATVVALGVRPAPNSQWLYGSSPYQALGVTSLEGAAIRLGVLAAGALCVGAFFVLCPRGASWLTAFGGRSLAPFLLHGFVIRGMEKAGLFAKLPVAACLLFGVLLALALGWSPIVRMTEPLWNPGRFFLRRVVEPKA